MCASSGKMADKNQLKIADHVDLADDDLTVTSQGTRFSLVPA